MHSFWPLFAFENESPIINGGVSCSKSTIMAGKSMNNKYSSISRENDKFKESLELKVWMTE